MNNRILLFDILRALSILWIVGVWHLSDYGCNIVHSSQLIGYSITVLSLSVFSFISGYLLSSKYGRLFYDCHSFRSFIHYSFYFMKRRLIRVIPLLLCSIVLLYSIGWFNNLRQILFTITGLSLIVPPAPPTLWFISMLLLFYIISPTILFWKNLSFRITSVLFWAIIFCVLTITANADKRLIFYFFFYSIGLFGMNSFFDKIRAHSILLIIFASIGLISSYLLLRQDIKQVFLCFFSMCGIVLAFYLCKVLLKSKVLTFFLCKISYASMAAYLFHRYIYYFFVNYWNFRLSLILIVPLVFVVSYCIQFVCDKITSNFVK